MNSFKKVFIFVFAVFCFVFIFPKNAFAAPKADYTSVSAFESLTSSQISAASALKVILRRASVGGNIDDGLDAMANSTYNRSNWIFYYEGNPGWQTKVDDFYSFVTSGGGGAGNTYDVLSMKFCWIDLSTDYNSTWTYYRDHMLLLESAFPNKKFVWWTMPIYETGEWNNAFFSSYNTLVRNYAAANNKILYDLASIESHDFAGNLTLVNGHEALYPAYTDDSGHLNPTGADRAAKAWWWLMAQIAGGSTGPTPTSGPSPTPTRFLSPTPTQIPTPTPTGTQTATFNDLENTGSYLSGQYPSGVINWGTNSWLLSGPWEQFADNSICFANENVLSSTFSFETPKILIGVDAMNGGNGSTTVTLSCSGNSTKTVIIPAKTLMANITTGWTNTCSGNVTVTSSNGWDTNFDNFVYASSVCGLAGDVDCSGLVNALDLSKLILKFGQTYSGREDVDGSGQVNAMDLAILLANFGK